MKTFFVIIFLLCFSLSYSQIIIGDPNLTTQKEVAELDIRSKESGILIPRFTKSEREKLKPRDNNWALWEGMLVYDTSLNALAYIHDGKWYIIKKS